MKPSKEQLEKILRNVSSFSYDYNEEKGFLHVETKCSFFSKSDWEEINQLFEGATDYNVWTKNGLEINIFY